MSEWIDAQALQRQRQIAAFGVVTYERGLELIEASGWIIQTGEAVCLYGDNAALAHHQRRTVIPIHRVVSITLDARERK